MTVPLSQPQTPPFTPSPAGYARTGYARTGNSLPPQNSFAAQLDSGQDNIPAPTEKDTENDFDFFDFLNIINPLQHIPVVSTFYRELTGDELHPASRIVGGTLYGAIPGAVSAVLNTITEGITGKDIGEHIADAFFGEDDTPQTARARDWIATNDTKRDDVKTGDAALAALYRDLRPEPPTTEPTPSQKSPATAPTTDTTLATFTRPGEERPRNGAFFVEKDRKWFHLRQAGNQQFNNSVRVQPPSFSPRRTLVNDPVNQSIEQSRAIENNLPKNNLMGKHGKAVQNYHPPTPPADLAAQMLRNLDRYEALKTGKETPSAKGIKP